MSYSAKRILVRSGKDPLQVVSPENSLDRSVPGKNFGNLLFSASAHKLLTAGGAVVESMGLGTTGLDPAKINDRYDVLVLPLANAFRNDFEVSLRRYTALIEKLTIPVVVLGAGAQSTIDYDVDSLAPLKDAATSFMRAVLDRSPSVGVRGEFTEQYLRGLGFNDVDVIGCPSMYLYGTELHVQKRLAALDSGSRIAVNASAVYAMGDIIVRNTERYPQSIYVGQSTSDLELLLWSESLETSLQTNTFPKHISHPLYQQNRVRVFVDPWTWVSSMRSFDFSFGARIHGNIAALLAGTPAVVLAHDSRTLELARYHDIPHQRLPDISPDVDAADLYERADFAAFNQGHEARFGILVDFLHKHGLANVFDNPADVAAFDRRVAATRFPPPVEGASHTSAADLVARMRWLRGKQARNLAVLTERVARLEAQLRTKPEIGHQRTSERRLSLKRWAS